MDNCFIVVFRDILGRLALHDGLNLRLLVEVFDVILGVYQQQLLGRYQVVQKDYLLVVALQRPIPLAPFIYIQDLNTQLVFDLVQGFGVGRIAFPLQDALVLGKVLLYDLLQPLGLFRAFEQDSVLGVYHRHFLELVELPTNDCAHEYLEPLGSYSQLLHSLNKLIKESAEVNLTEHVR